MNEREQIRLEVGARVALRKGVELDKAFHEDGDFIEIPEDGVEVEIIEPLRNGAVMVEIRWPGNPLNGTQWLWHQPVKK